MAVIHASVKFRKAHQWFVGGSSALLLKTPILLPITHNEHLRKREKIVSLVLVGAIGIDIQGGRIRGYYAYVSELEH